MLKEIAAVHPHTGADQDGSAFRLKTICAEFESIFMTYMLKSMRTAFVGEGIMGNSHGMEIMNAMFDENLAQETAKGGGVGLGDILFERLSEQVSERDGEGSATAGQKEKPVRNQGGTLQNII